MEEKYRMCDDSLSQLLAWIAEMEDRLANQDVAQEDIEQLRNQINILKVTNSPFITNTFNRYIRNHLRSWLIFIRISNFKEQNK